MLLVHIRNTINRLLHRSSFNEQVSSNPSINDSLKRFICVLNGYEYTQGLQAIFNSFWNDILLAYKHFITET